MECFFKFSSFTKKGLLRKLKPLSVISLFEGNLFMINDELYFHWSDEQHILLCQKYKTCRM